MAANPSTVPDKWEDFKIHTPDNETSEEVILDMRPWVRQHRGAQLTGLYYVCVYGELTATYSLRLKEFVQDFDQV